MSITDVIWAGIPAISSTAGSLATPAPELPPSPIWAIPAATRASTIAPSLRVEDLRIDLARIHPDETDAPTQTKNVFLDVGCEPIGLEFGEQLRLLRVPVIDINRMTRCAFLTALA
jgi:hypothetical protein